MLKTFYIITSKDLFDLLTRLSEDYKVYVPYKKADRLFLDKYDPAKEDSIELGGIRQSQPFKSILNPSRENMLNEAEADTRPIIVAGVKGCDLQSLRLQDFVFQEGDFVDPQYIKNRGNITIIGNDCTYAKETCFCLAMEGSPYPTVYYDMNLSPLENSFLVEVASEKGKAIIDNYRIFFKESGRHEINIRDKNREKVSGEVKDYIADRGTPSASLLKGVVKKNYNLANLWQDFSSTCVECGACNLVCPTCHCFLLFDEKFNTEARRLRIWDSCLYKSFARVAGGANPRRHLYERLRNRFDKKFDFFPQVLNYYACTGCGRCIEACPGDIDIREVLKGLVKGVWNKPPNE